MNQSRKHAAHQRLNRLWEQMPEAPVHVDNLAFPFAMAKDTTMFSMGLSVLDYFAMRAPREIPAWFMPEAEPYTGPKKPTIPADASLDDRNLLESWVRDGSFDLPLHLQWFTFQTDAHHLALAQHNRDYEMDRYFQWPYAWAESMLIVRDLYNDSDNDETPTT